MDNYNNVNRKNFNDRYKNNPKNNSGKKLPLWKKIYNKLTVKNILYYYTVTVITYSLISHNLKIVFNKQMLNYSVKDLFLIDIGSIISSITVMIFPALVAGILFNVIRKKMQHRRIGYLMTQGLKRKIFISILFSVLVVALHIYTFKTITTSHILYALLFAFFMMLLTLSAFLGIFKELIPALDTDLAKRNFSGRGNSGRDFNRNRNRNFNRRGNGSTSGNGNNNNNANRENFNR